MSITHRGRESRTLFFVSWSWFAVTLVFLFSRLSMHWKFFDSVAAPMSATEYGTTVAMILGIWLGSEIKEKIKQDQPGTPQ